MSAYDRRRRWMKKLGKEALSIVDRTIPLIKSCSKDFNGEMRTCKDEKMLTYELVAPALEQLNSCNHYIKLDEVDKKRFSGKTRSLLEAICSEHVAKEYARVLYPRSAMNLIGRR